MKKIRYKYINVAYIRSGAEHGIECDPVLRDDGKCVVGKGKQIVVFEDGVRVVVIRRCLRINRNGSFKSGCESGKVNKD